MTTIVTVNCVYIGRVVETLFPQLSMKLYQFLVKRQNTTA